MKKNFVIYVVVFMVLFFWQERLFAQPADLSKIKVPVWEKTAVKDACGNGYLYEETIMIKPGFYKGKTPLKFMAFKKRFSDDLITYYRDFDKFRNNFIYQDSRMKYFGIAEGAITIGVEEKLLAEARLEKLLSAAENNQLIGIQIEEFHYGKNGKLIFYCRSIFDFPMGNKTKEINTIGKKENEYYFIWPVSNY